MAPGRPFQVREGSDSDLAPCLLRPVPVKPITETPAKKSHREVAFRLVRPERFDIPTPVRSLVLDPKATGAKTPNGIVRIHGMPSTP